MRVYQRLAQLVERALVGDAQNEYNLRMFCKNYLPHGSGLDGKVEIDLQKSNQKKMVIVAEFHHMDENGFYSGWTEHEIILEPGFCEYTMKITGRNKNDIKTYLRDTFSDALDRDASRDPFENVVIKLRHEVMAEHIALSHYLTDWDKSIDYHQLIGGMARGEQIYFQICEDFEDMFDSKVVERIEDLKEEIKKGFEGVLNA